MFSTVISRLNGKYRLKKCIFILIQNNYVFVLEKDMIDCIEITKPGRKDQTRFNRHSTNNKN